MAQQITGAGSTFAAPIYAKWGEAAKGAIGVELNYQAIGSGAGQNQIFNRTVDFGASDAPVAADKLQSNHLLQFPTVMGGVDIIVNIPNVKPDELKLTGDVLAADLSRQDHQMERSEDRRAESRPQAAEPRDRAGLSRRRLGHDLRVHRLSLDGRPRLEEPGRLEHLGEVAGGHRRARQRRRLRRRCTNPRRHRLCRERLRDGEPPDHRPRSATRPASSSSPRWPPSRRRRRMPTGRRCRTSRSTSTTSPAMRAGRSSPRPSCWCRSTPSRRSSSSSTGASPTATRSRRTCNT